MGGDSSVESSPHDPSWPKTSSEMAYRSPDFSGVLTLVRAVAIKYSFWTELLREQMFSRQQLKRAAVLTDEDLVQIGKCRRLHRSGRRR
jgi:hypothetical protein